MPMPLRQTEPPSAPARSVTVAARPLTAEPFPHLKCLSPQERRIVALYALGYTNKEVGRELGIHPETVKSHARRVYIKLGVHSKAGCVAEAYERMGD
ncbi:helix-turn-helix transcriptional regulator [uncultured Aquimonas sp.]|uniref:response regulator transcription factor n=1 Tax=uncultured Aquimonas sp. TaxID=385483 RepID=UPI002630DA6E|nr:helix-turn-helix transcriptional regulator [uncultured Aquimonas sp.]